MLCSPGFPDFSGFRRPLRLIAAVALSGWALLSTAGPPAADAEPCPDVETVFARGTGEEPGLGRLGQIFVDDLRDKLGGRSLGVYPVNYPASRDWPTAINGIRDAADHIRSVSATCPDTRLVLGGYSQGAAVMGFVTADAVPDGVDASDVPQPLSPEVANHISAVVLFGKPNPRMMKILGQPPVFVGPLYADKTIDLCAPGDPVCSGGTSLSAHSSYAQRGIVEQGASYAAGRL